MTHNIFVNDKVHIRKRQCGSCIFGPNSPVSTERRDGMVADCSVMEHPDLMMVGVGVIPCHSHLHQDESVEPVCRGFYALDANPLLRLAVQLDKVAWA